MTSVVTALFLTLLTTGSGTSGSAVDTTIAVKRGTRLEVDNFAGEIHVRAWQRDALRIEASHSRRTRVDIDRSASVIRLTAVGRMMPGHVDYRLTVPSWMPVDLSGMSAEIDVEGLRAAVKAKSVNGGVRIEGGADLVTATSLQGRVEVQDVKGRVEVSSMNEGVKLRRIDGDVLAESMNGTIVLDQIEAKSLEANTVNGSIVFVGPMVSGGIYSLSTHNGSLVVGLSENPNVAVSVSTFSGAFSSSIPLSLDRGRRGKRFDFTLGSGSAKLELESFQGSVRLLRLSELTKRLQQIEDDEDGDHDEDAFHDWHWYEDQARDHKTKSKDKDKDEDKE
jgi:hypothetical protein